MAVTGVQLLQRGSSHWPVPPAWGSDKGGGMGWWVVLCAVVVV